MQGLLRQGYSSLRYPISSLAIGKNGAVQIFTFIFTGLLILLFAIAVQKILNKKSITVLLGLVGIGLIGSGIFITDPVFGYPENLPFKRTVFTLHGKLHTLFSLLVFINIPIICFIMTTYYNVRREFTWKYYSQLTGISMLLLFLATGFAFNQVLGMGSVAGLIQRLCVITGFVWIILFSFYLKAKPA